MQTTDTVPTGAAEAAFDVQAALSEAWAKVVGWIEGLVHSLPNLVAALLVLLVFWGLARVVRNVVGRLAARVADQPEVNRLVAAAAFGITLGLGLILALGALNLDKTVTSLLAGAGIIGLALGFAFQDIAENFIAGVILNLRNQFTEGDVVESGEFMGVIEHVELRVTVMRTFTGQRVLIPNAQILKSPIINYTQPRTRRVDVDVGVSYGDDLGDARRAAIEAVEGVEGRDQNRPVELFFTGFGDSSIDLQVRFWIPFVAKQADYLEARSQAIMRIKDAFDRAGVTIPFPIRTLDFAAGGSGGQGLTTALTEAGMGRSTAAGGSPGAGHSTD